MCIYLTSCSSVDGGSGGSDMTVDRNISIMAGSSALTRTQIDPSDMQSVMWEEEDQIALWAKSESSSKFLFEALPLSLYYYSPEYSSAIFTGNIPNQPNDLYTYFAIYPHPKSSNGNLVTLSLPATQSGYYDGVGDLMVARLGGQGPLSTDAIRNGSLTFDHLTHAIRIEVPKERDLLGATSKLQVTFPENVVGDAALDLNDANPAIELSKATNSVYIDFDQVISEAGYVWLFIRPTTIDGEIEFVGYDKDNIPSKPVVKTLSNREMAAGRITPITLTIPEESYRTVVLTISENKLGEDIRSVILKAPAGALFAGDKSEITVPVNADGNFEFSYSAPRYDKAFRSGEIAVSFESVHAIVPRSPIRLTAEDKYLVNYRNYTIPYLFEEDFSGISETGAHDLLHSKDLPGRENYWTNGRIFSYWEGKCVALKPYLLGLTCYYSYLSLDLNGKTFIKPDVKVDLLIECNADWKNDHMEWVKVKIYDNDNDDNHATFALTNNSKASENYIPSKHSVTYPNFTSDMKLVWQTRQKRDHGTDVYDYVYIDNIKISIK